MKAMLIGTLVHTLLALLTAETMKRALDALLDIVENAVEDSSTQVDDQLVLPLCKKIRKELEIPEFGT